MKSTSARFLASVMGVLALAASHARADYMNWGYATTATPPVVSSGTGTIQITAQSNGVSGASIPILALQNSSNATAASPDVYNSTYSLALTITDKATNDTRTLMLSGLLKGNLTATSSTVTNTLSGPMSVTFDGHTYTLSVSSLNLSAPGQPQQTLDAKISVTNASGGSPGGPPVASAPEPASLVLGALGFSFLGMGCWRKRRQPTQGV